jgi:hypothetical protein
MSNQTRSDRLIEWLRIHPLVPVGIMLFYAIVLALSWYIANQIEATPSSPFIYDI